MEEAIRYYRHIQLFYEERVHDPDEAKKFLPAVYYNHSKILGLLGRYDECIEICSRGLRYARKVQRFVCMPQTLHNMAWSMVRRNKPGDREAARQAAREGYALNSIYGIHKEIGPLIEKLLKDYYGEEPPEI